MFYRRHVEKIDTDGGQPDSLYRELEAGKTITVTDYVRKEVEHWCDWDFGELTDCHIWRNISRKLSQQQTTPAERG